MMHDIMWSEEKLNPNSFPASETGKNYDIDTPEKPIEPLPADQPSQKKVSDINLIASGKAVESGPTIVNECVKVPGVSFEDPDKLIYYKREELCRSVCGLPVWQITISRSA